MGKLGGSKVSVVVSNDRWKRVDESGESGGFNEEKRQVSEGVRSGIGI